MTTVAEDQRTFERGRKLLLWLSMASMAMAFAGLTSAFIVRQEQANWYRFSLPFILWVGTVLLVVSTAAVIGAQLAAARGVFRWAGFFLGLALALGIGFTVCQFRGWSELTRSGVFFVDKKSPSGAFFYVLTGLHLAHLFGGMIALLVSSLRSFFKKYSLQNYLGLKLTAIFWHFLTGLWLYIFIFVQVMFS
ncbi:MAG: cytochrome c oxidase subunit 3 [Flavobacteriales bacterium]|nr:cytochrome c oxidase subunit 3 [Flavobacteriales bacterium]MCX7768573.1 cytochrome c oxidase subunit 3 [Flavobacteriales bacterium]MDW8409458.1 cytochrome c oxidase subunit 3 [Flavobacteriales bacterium]